MVAVVTAIAILLGTLLAGGVLLVLDGLRPTAPQARRAHWPTMPVASDRLGRAVAGAVVLLALTRWPVAALGAGLLGWFWSDLVGGKAAREAQMARTEAIATWTEMLRDTIGAAHGLEAAISSTIAVAPVAIHDEVQRLAYSVEHQPLPSALAELADDLAHPIGDLVVSALTVAATGSTRELAELLGTLAQAARDEASMQLRVEAARARMRTAVKVITGCTVTTAVALIVLNPGYVESYGDVPGQVVLAFIALCWGTALWWLSAMSRFRSPERFLIAKTEVTR